MKREYWARYEFEGFGNCKVYNTPENWNPVDYDPDQAGCYSGPFATAKEARDLILCKLNNDLSEVRSMIQIAKGPAERID